MNIQFVIILLFIMCSYFLQTVFGGYIYDPSSYTYKYISDATGSLGVNAQGGQLSQILDSKKGEVYSYIDTTIQKEFEATINQIYTGDQLKNLQLLCPNISLQTELPTKQFLELESLNSEFKKKLIEDVANLQLEVSILENKKKYDTIQSEEYNKKFTELELKIQNFGNPLNGYYSNIQPIIKKKIQDGMGKRSEKSVYDSVAQGNTNQILQFNKTYLHFKSVYPHFASGFIPNISGIVSNITASSLGIFSQELSGGLLQIYSNYQSGTNIYRDIYRQGQKDYQKKMQEYGVLLMKQYAKIQEVQELESGFQEITQLYLASGCMNILQNTGSLREKIQSFSIKMGVFESMMQSQYGTGITSGFDGIKQKVIADLQEYANESKLSAFKSLELSFKEASLASSTKKNDAIQQEKIKEGINNKAVTFLSKLMEKYSKEGRIEKFQAVLRKALLKISELKQKSSTERRMYILEQIEHAISLFI